MIGDSLGGGCPEHKDATGAGGLVGREGKRLELPRQDRREETPREFDIVTEIGLVVDLAFDGHVRVVAIAGHPESQLQQTQEKDRPKDNRRQTEQPDPREGGGAAGSRGGTSSLAPLALSLLA